MNARVFSLLIAAVMMLSTLYASVAIPFLCEHPGDKAVVCIGSVNGSVGWLREFAYSCAKKALEGFVRCGAADYARFGIRFNLVAPASVPNPNSPTWSARLSDPRVQSRLCDEIYPLRRVGTTEDIAAALLYLASPMSAWVTGTTLYVDGGLMAIGSVKVRDDGRWWLPAEEEDEEVMSLPEPKGIGSSVAFK